MNKRFLQFACGLGLGLAATSVAALPVIPGAKGFGIDTPAGRGGKVYRVTNLNDGGSGSLRSCIEQSGPRVCVFEISGTIKLQKNLDIKNPYLTVAGQTAPSPGITLRGGTMSVANTHDVLVQHIRIRVGDDKDGPSPDNRDGFAIVADKAAAKNIVVDHLSVSWAIDENIQFWYSGVSNVTVRNTITSEGLYDSIHPKGPHSMGMIVGPGIKRVSILGNLFAHNYERNPLVKENTETEVLNNVIYNWDSRGVTSIGTTDIIGNHLKAGFNAGMHQKSEPILLKGDRSLVYTKDNIGPSGMTSGSAGSPRTSQSGYKPISSSNVMDWVLKNAGARPADRDSVDKRIVNDVRNGTGKMINSTRDVGGWPALAVNRRALTLPNDPSGDSDGDGYTNLEEWLHTFSAQVEGTAGMPTVPAAPHGLKVTTTVN